MRVEMHQFPFISICGEKVQQMTKKRLYLLTKKQPHFEIQAIASEL